MKKTSFTLLMLAATCLVAQAATVVGDFVFVTKYLNNKHTATIKQYLGNDEILTLPTEFTSDGVTYPVTEIGDYAFKKNNTIRELTIPEPYENIGKFAFAETQITKFDLPATLKKIDKQAFVEVPLDTMICRAAVPPAAWYYYASDQTNTNIWVEFGDIFHRIVSINWRFQEEGSNYTTDIDIPDPSNRDYFEEMKKKYVNSTVEAVLVVPEESMSLYKDAVNPHPQKETFSYGPWSNFENYISLDAYVSGVDNFSDDSFGLSDNVYDISGRCVAKNYDGTSPLNLKAGIYIFKGRKVAIK